MQLPKIIQSILLTTTLVLPSCAFYQKIITSTEQNSLDEQLTDIVSPVYNSESSSHIQQAILNEIIPLRNNPNPDTIILNKTELQLVQPINLSTSLNSEYLRERTNQHQERIILDIDSESLQQINFEYEQVSFDQELRDMVYPEPNLSLQDETKLSIFDAESIIERFQTHLENNSEQIVYRNLYNSRIRELSSIQNELDYEMRIRGGYPRGQDFGDYLEQEFMLDLYKETRRLVTRSITDTLKNIDLYELIRPLFRFDLKRDAPVISDILQTTTEEKNPAWLDNLLE